jgi:hypothetical protein
LDTSQSEYPARAVGFNKGLFAKEGVVVEKLLNAPYFQTIIKLACSGKPAIGWPVGLQELQDNQAIRYDRSELF